MKFFYVHSLVWLHVQYRLTVSDAFSTVSPGRPPCFDSDHQDLDIDEFFFADQPSCIDSESHGNRRRRFSVEYIPVTPPRPPPPLHPPHWRGLEMAPVPIINTMEPIARPSAATLSSMDPFIILASAAGGLWTVAPIVYWHCMLDQQNMVNLFPFMILAAGIEVTAMLCVWLAHPGNAKPSVAIFAALRVGAACLLAEPLNFSLEILEGLVLFASSLLLLEALSSHHHDTTTVPSP